MFIDPSSAVAAVGAAQRDLDQAVACLTAADPAPWSGSAATSFAAARDAVLVTAHAVDRELRGARECLRAFEQECATWSALPHEWL